MPSISKLFTVLVLTNEDGDSEIWTFLGELDDNEACDRALAEMNENATEADEPTMTREQFDNIYSVAYDVRDFDKLVP